MHRLARPCFLLIAALLAGCQPPAAAPGLERVLGAPPEAVPVTTAVAPRRMPLPQVSQAGYRETDGTATLGGVARFEAVTEGYFGNSAANFHLLSMPAGRALVNLSSIEEEVLVKGGTAISGATDTGGAFALVGNVPVDFPYVVNVNVVQNHRLSALVTPGQGSVLVDEASSMIVETARWQLPEEPATTGLSLQDMTATVVAELAANTRALLTADDLPVTGDIPNIEALKVGNGHALRSAYVGRFGRQVGADPTSVAPADALSDRWKTLLGYRPLALTIAAGNAGRSDRRQDDRPATEEGLYLPVDAVADASGNVWISEQDSHTIRMVPAADRGGLWAWGDDMDAGSIYTIAGTTDGPNNVLAFDAVYAASEAASVTDPEAAPLVTASLPLFTPHRVVLEPTAGGTPNLFFTSYYGNRVMLIAGEDFNRYGRDFEAGRLYTIAGLPASTPEPSGYGDNGLAHQASLYQPTGLQIDSQGNLYVLDSGLWRGGTTYHHGSLRVIRAATGTIHSLRYQIPGSTGSNVIYRYPGSNDMRLIEAPGANALYMADSFKHIVSRLPLPDDLSYPTGVPTSYVQAMPVLGKYQTPGYLAATVPAPTSYTIAEGVPAVDVRLNAPTSLDFDHEGNMVIADSGNGVVRVYSGTTGLVYTVAGGFDTRFLSGDSRLAFLPGTLYLNRNPVSNNLLITDRFENVVRELWTRRGSY